MMFELRYYQRAAVDAIIQHINLSTAPCLAVFPTGAGKSLIPATLANFYFDKKVLILQPSLELLTQNLSKFVSVGGDDVTVNSASVGSRSSSGRVVFATIGSIHKTPVQFDIIIIDEAHYIAKDGQYKYFLDRQRSAKVVGLTATPFRNERVFGDVRKVPIYGPKSFFELVYVYQISEIIKDGYWSEYRYSETSFSDSGLVSTGEEYTASSVEKVLSKQNVLANFLKHFRENVTETTPTLVFAPSIKSCKYILTKYPNAAFVHGKLSTTDRKRMVQQILVGQKNLILNVGTLVTGFDYPALSTVYFLDPTASLSRYYQMFGRAIRPFPGKVAHYFDFVGNRSRLGDISNIIIK